MIPVFNDEDIIQEVIEHLLSQNIELVILDNGSTDQSFKICERFLGKGVLRLEQYQTQSYQWQLILRKLYDMAIFQSPDWVLRCDSDEFLESGMKNLSLYDGISMINEKHFNIIQFDRFDFFMTDDDDESAISFKEKLRYYSYQDDFVYRAWKFIPGILPIGKGLGGHCPIFPLGESYKISDTKFILRHYPLRSKDQAIKKISSRLNRRVNQNAQKNIHLDKTIQQKFFSSISHEILTKYNEDNKWNFEKKYTPFIEQHPTKQELFSKEGFLIFEPTLNQKKKIKIKNNTTKNPDSGTFFIKKNYLHRLSIKYYDDMSEKKDGQIFQPYILPLAEFFGDLLGCTHLIDLGCGNAQKLVNHYPKYDIIGIDFKDNIKKCKEKYNFGTWIDFDFEKPNTLNISNEILQKSIIVCADVIEHLENPTHLLNLIHEFLDVAPLCIISTPERDLKRGSDHFGPPLNPHHIREWNMIEFDTLLRSFQFNLVFRGLTISNTKDNLKETIIVGLGNNFAPNSLIKFEDSFPYEKYFSFNH